MVESVPVESSTNWLLAVDPGDAHVGFASWQRYRSGGHSFLAAHEALPDEALQWVANLLRWTGKMPLWRRELVVEEFVLYPDKASALSWQRLLTSEMVGALKWIGREAGVPVVEQGANIQAPTAAQLSARGIPLIEAGPHAKSAQLHLWHRLLKEGIVEGDGS